MGNGFAIGGIGVMVLVFGIVEALKDITGLSGAKAIRGTALVLGLFFVILAQVLNMGLIPEPTSTIIIVAVTSIAAVLSAMGYYNYAEKIRNGG